MKSRSNSAFFVFWRSVFYGVCGALVVLLMQAAIMLPFKQWEIFLHLPELWVLPLVTGFGIFLWNLSRKGLWRALMLLVLTGAVGYVFLNYETILDHSIKTAVQTRIHLNRHEQIQKPDYDNARLIALEPFPIYYVPDDQKEEFPQENLDVIVANIQNLPSNLLEYPSALYLMGEDTFMTSVAEMNNPDVYGYATPANMAVYIRLVQDQADSLYSYLHNGQAIMLNNPWFYTETIIHEMAHLMDAAAGGKDGLRSNSAEFKAIYEANQDTLSEYASVSPQEFFAEGAVYWYLYPDQLQERSNEVYSFFAGM